MKTALTTILTICLFAPQVIAGNTVEKQYCINADFLYNYDGDSLTATFPQLANALGKDIDPAGILWYKAKIRVLGIDTPEKRGKCKATQTYKNTSLNRDSLRQNHSNSVTLSVESISDSLEMSSTPTPTASKRT